MRARGRLDRTRIKELECIFGVAISLLKLRKSSQLLSQAGVLYQFSYLPGLRLAGELQRTTFSDPKVGAVFPR